MARESTQHKLDRVRSPRVHITYDVETGGAIELKELPFVVGVLGDLTPHLAVAVENKLSDEPDAPNLKVNLNFKSMDDFEPENVARQVPALKQLLDLRQRMSDLRGSLQGNDKLEELLLEAVGNTEKLEKLKGEMKEGSNG